MATDTDEVMVGEGVLELIRDDDRFLLVQGEVAVDITTVIKEMNYNLGKVVLNIRLSEYKKISANTDAQELFRKTYKEPVEDKKLRELRPFEDEMFVKVSGADATED